MHGIMNIKEFLRLFNLNNFTKAPIMQMEIASLRYHILVKKYGIIIADANRNDTKSQVLIA